MSKYIVFSDEAGNSSATIPCPGLELRRIQLADTILAANGRYVSQKIGRQKLNINNIEFRMLSGDTWKRLLNIFASHVGSVTFWNEVSGQYEKIQVIFGESSEFPYRVDGGSGKVLFYEKCIISITDMGYEPEVVENV